MPDILTFEAEIRDTEAHTSDVMADDANVTVNEDTLHPNSLENYESIRVYVDDTHDEGYDLTVRHTAHDDDDYSAENDHTTYSVSTGQDQTTITITGPAGQIRLHTGTTGTAAPTTGRLRVTLYCYP